MVRRARRQPHIAATRVRWRQRVSISRRHSGARETRQPVIHLRCHRPRKAGDPARSSTCVPS
jgi:hypothetical protein